MLANRDKMNGGIQDDDERSSRGILTLSPSPHGFVALVVQFVPFVRMNIHSNTDWKQHLFVWENLSLRFNYTVF